MTLLRPRVPRPALLALGVVVGLLGGVFGAGACTSSGDGDLADPTGPAGAPAIVVADAPSLPDSVDALPPIDVGGFDALLADVRGTPLVVNFWASWCDPCERELPLLVQAAERHRDSVQFLGVDVLDTPAPARAFLGRFDVPYPNVADPSGETRDSVGSLGQPVTVFYGADGDVVAKVDGELSRDELDRHLAAILPS